MNAVNSGQESHAMETVAVVGATGAVGQEFRALFAERRFVARRWKLLASARSAGKEIPWLDGPAKVEPLTDHVLADVELAFFSAGGSVSKEFAPRVVENGGIVIDNSSAFRMDPEVPLVVPEVNPEDARQHQGIIANPNCSTIIMLVPLWPLHQRSGIKRVVVDTYQAISGAGARALAELEQQTREVLDGKKPTREVLPHACAFNVFSHNTEIGTDGLNVEERKMVLETRKIFHAANLQIAPTCMRVPVPRAHTEALTVEFERPLPEAEARELLAAAAGVEVVDDRAANRFPMPIEATGRDAILVGRIRQDPTVPDQRGLQFICCGDQLRKGAALNAVQIAELLRC